MNMPAIPLIWTTEGNLPLADLIQTVIWTENEGEIVCAVAHWLGEKCVRQEAHILKKTGLAMAGAVGEI
jgi:hypothetical protein